MNTRKHNSKYIVRVWGRDYGPYTDYNEARIFFDYVRLTQGSTLGISILDISRTDKCPPIVK